ncbi:MAG: hypothetical protein QM674_23370, partial [Burkholderiaceae bacterium]
AARRRLAGMLARDGFDARTAAAALGCVAAHAKRSFGIEYFETQYLCAAALLDQRLVEMATGEGKTLAAALAAAAAALGGMPVHVITANDYLARRDAAQLRPLFESLGLTVAAVTGPDAPDDDAGSPDDLGYRADIVYATARTIAFDYLRDRAACPLLDNDLHLRALAALPASPQPDDRPALRGLCLAIIDEVDSILIDEARMPLILSTTHADPDERARLWQALDWARRLRPDLDYRIDTAGRRVSLTDEGRAALARDHHEYQGFGLNAAHRRELIEQALAALFVMRRDVDYLVSDDEVVIVDAVTGRSAPGRIWSRGLHGLVALKEGLPIPDATRTLGRTLYRRFFGRYHHLCGLSGTLAEVRRELRRDYGLALVEVPLRRPSRRRALPERVFADRRALFEAALRRAVSLVHDEGRAVLLTTDSIADTRWFEAGLADSGVPYAVLNAATAAEESAIIAQAGMAARVTVATQMAGRGTDIALSDAVRQAGGLHVLNLQHNRSRRIDRQIAGRAARQGNPGSCEHWRCIEAALAPSPSTGSSARSRIRNWAARRVAGRIAVRAAQRLTEREDASLRRGLLRGERRLSDGLLFSRISE